jgi:hypothetical protein
MLDHLEHQEAPDQMLQPVNLDPKDRLAHLVNLVAMAHLATQVNQHQINH